jgi:hypothetical protein
MLFAALMPTINSMSATGLVSLPGMMTGQILSGVPPVEAVKYQILVMFLIAGGTGFGAVAAVLGGVYRLTDGRHRLRLDRLSTRRAAEGLAFPRLLRPAQSKDPVPPTHSASATASPDPQALTDHHRWV